MQTTTITGNGATYEVMTAPASLNPRVLEVTAWAIHPDRRALLNFTDGNGASVLAYQIRTTPEEAAEVHDAYADAIRGAIEPAHMYGEYCECPECVGDDDD